MVGRWTAVKVHGLSVSLSPVWVKMALFVFLRMLSPLSSMR